MSIIKKNKSPWYKLTVTEIKKSLETDSTKGLEQERVLKLQKHYGKNLFTKSKKITLFDRIIDQVKSPLVLILIMAAVVTFLLEERVDTLVISIALIINIVIGVIQEKRASGAFEKLVASQEKHATVIRDGEKKEILAEEIVPGDVIWIEPGVSVPADARIISAHGITTNESSLTGEWKSVSKQDGLIKENTQITEQTNMLWMGTLVVSGNGKAIVVEIGDKTQMGIIASHLADKKEDIPLQKNIKKLASFLTQLVVVTVILLIFAGIVRGIALTEILMIAIAVAVATMPEGLPAAVTVVLAIGMESILKKGGLVRNLLAAETLGNTTIILTDKTGTLTKAEMRVADILTEKSICSQDKTGRIPLKDSLGNESDKKDVLSMALLTSEGYVEGVENALGEWVVHGNPVERAIILAGIESGLRVENLTTQNKRLDVFPFESKSRLSLSLNNYKTEEEKENRLYIVGAPELLLEYAEFVYSEGEKKELSDETRKILAHRQLEESQTGMRVVAVGYKEVDWKKIDTSDVDFPNNTLENIVFGGFIVLHDPIRGDVKESIKIAREAGTEVIMLTGDNPVTALKIAEEAGIIKSGEKALTGLEIEKLSDEELLLALKNQKVFARVLPHQKLRIVQLLKSQGEVVAMTGDGVNDAPALRNADIGISLGSGTDVAKEASDIILLNNSFSIIVSAIEEGRRIRDNLKKIVVYLVSTGFSELFVVSVSIIVGKEIPILATQILWINIIEEGLMNFAFAFEPKEPDIMKRSPRDESMKEILTPSLKKLMTIIALTTGTFLIALYFILLHFNISLDKIRTIMFIALSVDSIFFTFSIKNLHRPIWKINPLSNKYLVYAFGASFGALMLALEWTPLQKLLSLTPLSGNEFSLLFGLGLINLVIIEVGKFVVFREKN